MSQTVRPERTGWRDQGLSERHRRWGWHCPAIDLDFLLLEFDSGKAVALVEFKHERAALQWPTHPSYQALIDLGNRAGLPVFACRYADDFSWWRPVPLNRIAKTSLPHRQNMTEQEWVSFLYQLRGRKLPDDLFVQTAVAI
jgi:hypothetical protein